VREELWRQWVRRDGGCCGSGLRRDVERALWVCRGVKLGVLRRGEEMGFENSCWRKASRRIDEVTGFMVGSSRGIGVERSEGKETATVKLEGTMKTTKDCGEISNDVVIEFGWVSQIGSDRQTFADCRHDRVSVFTLHNRRDHQLNILL
jgi:hypothetical protein